LFVLFLDMEDEKSSGLVAMMIDVLMVDQQKIIVQRMIFNQELRVFLFYFFSLIIIINKEERVHY
jgi:hypothetical protein